MNNRIENRIKALEKQVIESSNRLSITLDCEVELYNLTKCSVLFPNLPYISGTITYDTFGNDYFILYADYGNYKSLKDDRYIEVFRFLYDKPHLIHDGDTEGFDIELYNVTYDNQGYEVTPLRFPYVVYSKTDDLYTNKYGSMNVVQSQVVYPTTAGTYTDIKLI